MKPIDELLVEAAETLSEYGAIISPNMIKKAIEQHDDLKQELFDESYTDTCVREKFLDVISMNAIGMKWPTNGDTAAYKQSFYTIAMEKGFVNRKK